jgi:uncharacterized membrane protein YhaH (DUF805 family)
MKKTLLFVFFLIYSFEASASHCGHDIDRSWHFTSSSYSKNKLTKSQINSGMAKYARWTFKNKTKKDIIITSIGLWAKDNQTVMAEAKRKIHLKPFGVIYSTLYVGDINLEVKGSGFSSCKYGVPSKTTKKKNYNAKKYFKPAIKYEQKPKDNFTLPNLILIIATGLLIYIFVAAKNRYKILNDFSVIKNFANYTIICFEKYSSFKGNASRSEYWYFYLFCFIAGFLTYLIDVWIFHKDPDGVLYINALVTMVTLLPSFAVGARRLHDVGKSGWWQLIAFTVIGLIPLIIWLASKPTKQKKL